MAAVLACGQGAAMTRESMHEGRETILGRWRAALSHRSAAELWGLLPPRDSVVDVSVAGDGGRKKRSGIRVHRSRALVPAAVTLRAGLPVTSPARTLADLRPLAATGRQGLISPRELRRATRQAAVLGLSPASEVVGDRTRSDLERDFLRLCRRRRLPVPEVNVRIGSHLVDFLWREPALIVETDGYRYHRGRVAFEDDRVRDLELRAWGFGVVRLAARQIEAEPEGVAEVLAAVIRRRTPQRRPHGPRHSAP